MEPFNFGSIMMYEPTEFSRDNVSPTIVKRGGLSYTTQRVSLALSDIAALNRMYNTISKYAISGDQLVEPMSQVSYNIFSYVDFSNVQSIFWSVEPSTATVLSGQGSSEVTIAFPSQTGSFSVNAIIRFKSGYNRTLPSRAVVCAELPVIRELYCSKYFQGDGEYTLYADVASDRSATVDWSCSTNAVFHDLPYPDDGSFAQYPNLYRAIDFYEQGPHQITAYSTNRYGTTSHSQTFYYNDTKSSFPMSFSANPVVRGRNVVIEVDPQEKSFRNAEYYTIEVRTADNDLVCQMSGSAPKITLDPSVLSVAGRYVVMVSKQNARKKYVSHLEVR